MHVIVILWPQGHYGAKHTGVNIQYIDCFSPLMYGFDMQHHLLETSSTSVALSDYELFNKQPMSMCVQDLAPLFFS